MSQLYVYNFNNLSNLRREMQDYRFYSLPYFFNRYDDIQKLSDIDTAEFNKCIVDLSGIARDNSCPPIFLERYIYKLRGIIDVIHFCIEDRFFTILLDHFPLLFEEEQINLKYSVLHSLEAEDTEKGRIAQFEPIILYVYDDFDIIKSKADSSQFISLANLLEESQGAWFSYHLPSIDSYLSSNDNHIKYIDISSAVRASKLRGDYVYQIEILLYHMVTKHAVSMCIESAFAKDALKCFPFVFSDVKYLDEAVTEDVASSTEKLIANPQVTVIQASADRICSSLKGHEAFKKDFKQNLLKFSFLNQIQERKLLSIILCGISGIGKTQFAKIASEVLYPKEELIKINFGNYSTEGVLNSLIGSPLGYVGSEEGGELINKIALSKSKVILIDEFERATPSVYNFFYELLEDGMFTDRHGVQHDLNGYIIVFTSNMSQEQYKKQIPDSLKSRFDMIYYFEDLPDREKEIFIHETADKLSEKLNQKFGAVIDPKKIEADLDSLISHSNLRYIKRRIEDIVFKEFFNTYRMHE